MNELKEILMEQLQLIHEYSKTGEWMPDELTGLSKAMANIAEVVIQIGDDVNNVKGAGITTDKLACIGLTADKLTDAGISPPEWVKSLIPEEDYARLQDKENL